MDSNKIKCLLCGGSAVLIHEKYPGYQKPDTFKIYHCSECNTSFSLPEVHTSIIYENIYKNGVKYPDIIVIGDMPDLSTSLNIHSNTWLKLPKHTGG